MIEHLLAILIEILILEGKCEKFRGKIQAKPGYEFAALSHEYRSFSISFETKMTGSMSSKLFDMPEISRESLIDILSDLEVKGEESELTKKLKYHKMFTRLILQKLRTANRKYVIRYGKH